MPVYLANGRLLGRTEDISHAVDAIHVRQGHILVRDWYIPLVAVQTVNGNGVYLGASIAEMRQRGWDVPGEAYLARQGATPGYEYTSVRDIPSYGDAATDSANAAKGEVNREH